MSGTSSHHQHASGPKRTRSETPTCPEEGSDQDPHADAWCEHVRDEVSVREKPRQLGGNRSRGAKVGVKEVQGKRRLGGGGGSVHVRGGEDSPCAAEQLIKQTSSLSTIEKSHTLIKVDSTARTHITLERGDSVAVGGRPRTTQKEGQMVSERCGIDSKPELNAARGPTESSGHKNETMFETECGVVSSNGGDAEDGIDVDARHKTVASTVLPQSLSEKTKDCPRSKENKKGEEEENKDNDNAEGNTHAKRDEESQQSLHVFEKEGKEENKNNKNFPAAKSTGDKKAPWPSSRQQHNPYAPVVKTPTAASGVRGALSAVTAAAGFGPEVVADEFPKSSAPVALGLGRGGTAATAHTHVRGGRHHQADSMYIADYPPKIREHEHTVCDSGNQYRQPAPYWYYPQQSYHNEGPPPHYYVYNSLFFSGSNRKNNNNHNHYGSINTHMHDSHRTVSFHSDNVRGVMSTYPCTYPPQPHRLSAADVRSWYRTEQNVNPDVAVRRPKEYGLGLVDDDHDTDDAQAGVGRRPPPILSTRHHRAEEDGRRAVGEEDHETPLMRKTLTNTVLCLAGHYRDNNANIDDLSVGGPPALVMDGASRRGGVHDSRANTINSRTNEDGAGIVDDNRILPPHAKASKAGDKEGEDHWAIAEVEVATEESPTPNKGESRGQRRQTPQEQEQFGPYDLRGGGRPTSIRSFGRRPREEYAEDYRTIEEEEVEEEKDGRGNLFIRLPPPSHTGDSHRHRAIGPTAGPNNVDDEEALYDDNFFGCSYTPPHLSLPQGSRRYLPTTTPHIMMDTADNAHFRAAHADYHYHGDFSPRGYSIPLPPDYANTRRLYDDTSRYMRDRVSISGRGEGLLYTTTTANSDGVPPSYCLPHAYPSHPHHRNWGDPSWSEHEWKREAVRWSSIAKQHEEQIADLKRHNAELAHENNELRGALAASRRSYSELETSYARKLADFARLQTAAPQKATDQRQREQQQRRSLHHHPASGTSASGMDHCSLTPNRQSSPPAHVPLTEVVVGTSESAAADLSSQPPALATPTAWESITAVVVHPLTHSKRFYCEVCNVLVNSEVSLKAHLEGDKHRKGQYRLQYRNRNAVTAAANAQSSNTNTSISINEDGAHSKHGVSSAGGALLASSASVAPEDASPPLPTPVLSAAVIRDAR